MIQPKIKCCTLPHTLSSQLSSPGGQESALRTLFNTQTSSKQDADVSIPCMTDDEDMSSSDGEIGILPSSSGGRRRQLPARNRDADDSDGND